MGLPSNAVEYSTWPAVPSASIQSLLMRRRPVPASITFMVYFRMGGVGSNLDFAMLRSQSPKSASRSPAIAAPAAVRPRLTTASVAVIILTVRTVPRVFMEWMRRKLALRSRGRSRVEVNLLAAATVTVRQSPSLRESSIAEPKIRPCARHCFGNVDDGHDCHRSDHRVHSDAADRRRPGWIASLQLGVFLISAGANRHDCGVWKSRGRVWPQAGHAGGNRDFPAWIAVRRIRMVHAGPDLLPACSRRRRG